MLLLTIARAQYHLMRDDHDAKRAAFETQYEADGFALDIEYRELYAQTYGLDALDRLDGFGIE